jgi:hypothetical protein
MLSEAIEKITKNLDSKVQELGEKNGDLTRIKVLVSRFGQCMLEDGLAPHFIFNTSYFSIFSDTTLVTYSTADLSR